MSMGKLPEEQGGDDGGIFADINITPLTDIFLVLLIIFMVTASAAVDAGQGNVDIKLPQGGTAADATKTEPPLDIFVLQDSRLMIDGKEVSELELEARLKAEIQAKPQLIVRVRADQDLKHRRVVEVLDLVRKAGVARLSIATQVKTSSQ